MHILNIAGYKFIHLQDKENLHQDLLEKCSALQLKGTILLSDEGINLSLAGMIENINAFKIYLRQDSRFLEMTFRESYSVDQPFKRLKIKLKKEIITLRQPEASPTEKQAENITPETFKQWLDEKRNITILDTRNDYEVRFGSFVGAINLHLKHFTDFPAAIEKIEKDKPIVMFCTGGIRCEKAALYMLTQGYPSVYQLEGGILNYFAKVGQTHYEGECFVFDERTSVDAKLKSTGTIQCQICNGPVTQAEQQLSSFVPGISCPSCANHTD